MPSGYPKQLTPADPAIITAEETGRRLALEVHTVHAFFRDGTLPAIQFSHVWRAYWPAIATHHGIDPGIYPEPPPDSEEHLVPLAEAAERLGVTTIVARGCAERGVLPAVRVVNRWRVPWAQVIDRLSGPTIGPNLAAADFDTEDMDAVTAAVDELTRILVTKIGDMTGLDLAEQAAVYARVLARADQRLGYVRARLSEARAHAHARRHGHTERR
jgi:hypothetical protein